jgi:hypothetical protein
LYYLIRRFLIFVFCVGGCLGKILSSTQYLHTISFEGKQNIKEAISLIDIPKVKIELNCLFDTGAYHNVVDASIAQNAFDILQGSREISYVAGLVVDANLVAYAIASLGGKNMELVMRMTSLHQLVVGGVKIDVIVGLPTMCEWGIMIDTTNGHVALKVIESMVLERA